MTGVFSAAIGGSALILLVLGLRRLFAKQLPRRLFPALWCAAALRLLLPVEIPTHLSLWNLLQGAKTASSGGAVSEVLRPFPALTSSISQSAAAGAESSISPVLAVWGIGAALLAAYLLIGYFCMTRRFDAAQLSPQADVFDLLARFHVSREPRLCRTDSSRAPLTYGVLRPTVLLPEALRGEAFTFVLAHELAHVKARDCLKKLLFAACLCLYWWNPLVWRMVKAAGEDLELSCDEAVLHALGPGCKKAYALTLLSMAQTASNPAPLCTGFAKRGVETRIRAILNYRRVPVRTGILAAAAFLLAACVFATQAVPAKRAVKTPATTEEISILEPEKAPEPVSPAPKTAEIAPSSASEPESAQEDLPEAAPKYVFPLENTGAAVTDVFGWREHPVTGTRAYHSGVDLEASGGSNVLAAADGTVLMAEYNEAYGYFVQLEHEDGVQTFYAHLQELLVSPGESVQQGQIIALSGSSGWATGPHLHLGVYIDGEAVEPLSALQSTN